MERIIMHIDVNNAFLSWSAVYYLQNGSNIDIRTIPSAIAGEKAKRTGIILAKSIPAKKMGIKTGDIIYIAKNKCPSLKIYPPNYKFYSEMSKKMFDYLYSLTPDIEIASIDECYIDYGKIKKLYGDEFIFAKKINKEIKEKFGFTVNIGIANNKLCAKMASDFEKPDKIHTLYDYEVDTKMKNLPIDELFGIGKKTSEKLKQMGIKTINDLANYNLASLKKVFKNQAIDMINSANGINYDEVETKTYINKGISNEITLVSDCYDDNEIYDNLLYLSDLVSYRIRKINKYATTVAVIIKNNNFVRKTHQKKLNTPINTSEDIYNIAKEIYKKNKEDEGIRLIGIRLDNLKDEKLSQVSLFDLENNNVDNEKLDKTIDKLKENENVITLKVTSEKGDVKEYKLVVTRLKEGETLGNNPDISELNIKGYDINFSKDKQVYSLKIEKEKTLNIEVILEDPTSSYKITGNNDLKDGSIIKINTTSKDGSTREYQIVIEKENKIFLYIIGTILILSIVGLIVYVVISKIKENKDNPKQPKEKDVKVKTNIIKNKNQEEVDLDKIEQQLKEIEDKKSKLLDVTKPISIIPDNVNDLTKQEELKEIKEKQDNLLEEVNAIKEQIKEEGVKTCNICGHKILSSLEVCPYCKRKF